VIRGGQALLGALGASGTTVYQFVVDGGKHNSQDFKRQHLTLPPLDVLGNFPHSPLSTTQVNDTMKCISSAHEVPNAVNSTESLLSMLGLAFVCTLEALLKYLSTLAKETMTSEI
jgi:hypothetical protein